MISVEKAHELIRKNSKTLKPVSLAIENAYGHIVAKNILAPVSLPPFNQSAMDGYAFRYADLVQKNKIKVVGEVQAGSFYKGVVKKGNAVRIFTGAPLPTGTDTVVMQEKVKLIDGHIVFDEQILVEGSNVRKTGSQIAKGKIAMPKGTIITPGGIGFITAMGISTVEVIRNPRISIIVTGSELRKPGSKLKSGQIFESNSYTIDGALKSINLLPINIYSVKDSASTILNTIKKAIAKSDLVLITGGISVGDYDFVGSSLLKLGVKNIFYKIKQKPGKPLFFGKSKNTLVFGLPGNPAAVLSCFYEYVYPAIRSMQGRATTTLKTVFLPIGKDYPKKKGLSFFLKGKISGNMINPLEGQESYILSSFALADSIIYFPEDVENIRKGDIVEVHLLPHP